MLGMWTRIEKIAYNLRHQTKKNNIHIQHNNKNNQNTQHKQYASNIETTQKNIHAQTTRLITAFNRILFAPLTLTNIQQQTKCQSIKRWLKQG